MLLARAVRRFPALAIAAAPEVPVPGVTHAGPPGARSFVLVVDEALRLD